MRNIFKYRKILLVCFAVQISILIISFFFALIKYSDTPLTITNVLQTSIKRPELKKAQKLTYSFKAETNNLGIVSLYINTYNRNNDDTLVFGLKERGKLNWIYLNSYNTKNISDSEYYPFGFPKQTESKGKAYEITIISQRGRSENSIGISNSGKFLVKYIYTKKSVLNSLESFLLLKIRSYLSYIEPITIISSSFLYIGFFLIFFFKRRLLTSLLNYFDTQTHIRLIKSLVSRISIPKVKFEIAMVMFFLLLFIDSALFGDLYLFQKLKIDLLILFSFLHILFIYLITTSKTSNYFFSKLKIDKYIGVGSIFIIVLYLPFLKDLPRFDGGNNFMSAVEGMSNFDFSFFQFFRGFQWYGHSSHGIAFIISILSFLQIGNTVLLQASFMMLCVATYISLYYLYRNIFIISRGLSSIYSILICTTPLLFSTSLNISLDYPSFAFFIIFITLLSHSYYILAVFAGTLSLFSKEIGVLIYSAYIGSLFLIEISPYYMKFNINQKTLSILRLIYKYFILFIPLFVFIIYVVVNGGKVWGGSVGSINTSLLINTSVMYQRFGQIFILNGSWIYVLLLIYLILLNKKINCSIFHNKYYFALIITWLVYLCFNLTYVTVTHPRYVVMAPFFLITMILYYLSFDKKIGFGISFAVIGIIFNMFQLFYSIDPLSIKYFGSMKFGKHTIFKISDDFSSRCDSMVYNTEYVYINRLLNAFNKRIQVAASDTLIFNVLNEKYHRNKWLAYYEYMNIEKSYILTYKIKNTYKPSVLYTENLAIHKDKKYQGNIYYVFLPWLTNNVDLGINEVKKYYKVGEGKTIDIDGYWLRYYKLTKLSQ